MICAVTLTLAQALGVTSYNWSVPALQRLFAWLRPVAGTPAMQAPLCLPEAVCVWTYALCQTQLRLPPALGDEVFHHIRTAVRDWLPADCPAYNRVARTPFLLVVADDCYYFCTGQAETWNLHAHVPAPLPPADTFKSTAYNLSVLTGDFLLNCSRRDPVTGQLAEDPASVSAPPPCPSAAYLDQPG